MALMETNGKIKMMTLDQLKDEHIGKVGTTERDEYELELKVFRALRTNIKFSLERMDENYGIA